MSMTPIQAIRKKCLNCSNGQYVEVRNCPANDCSLWEYRLGKRPPKINSKTKTHKLAKDF